MIKIAIGSEWKRREQQVACAIDPEFFNEFGWANYVAHALRHFLAVHSKKAVHKNLLRQFHLGRHQQRWPA